MTFPWTPQYKQRNHLIHSYLSYFTTYPYVWLGTWTMGGHRFGSYDQRYAHETLEKAFDLGIRIYDSCSFYAKGQSDALLQSFLSQKDDLSYALSYKGGLRWEGNTVVKDGSSSFLTRSVENALKFFNRDYIDMFFLHWVDPEVDLKESLDALHRLQADQKIKFWGVCNVDESHVDDLLAYKGGLIQQHYNPLFRQSEQSLIRLMEHGYALSATSPFEQGLLLNSDYLDKHYFGKKDYRQQNAIYSSESRLEALRVFFEKCKNIEYLDLYVFLWILNQQVVDHVILGARYPEQLDFFRYVVLHKEGALSEEQAFVWSLLDHLYLA
ncbi:hypothetical protein DID78_05345 [Candidatus Marinamargulisbacteria bacterium SCGC AG-343-D04]|nr:hypothetical protein DID78_05345 [Candidatus Marinamargulisbacteria bacterium SCGC AG-343-D04]